MITGGGKMEDENVTEMPQTLFVAMKDDTDPKEAEAEDEEESDDARFLEATSAALDEIFGMYKQLFIMFLVILIYLTVGQLWFCLYEKLSFLDGLFVTTIIITTVGYGTTAHYEETYYFLIFFTIAGVGIIGGVIGGIWNIMSQLVVKEKKDHFNYIASMKDFEESETSTSEEDEDFRTIVCSYFQDHYGHYWVWLILLIAGALIIGAIEGWTWLHSIYFGIVTCSTVGFGDFTPATVAGKWLTIIYLPIMTTYTVYIFSALFANSVSNLFDDREQENSRFKSRMENVMTKKNFQRRFDQLDLDGDHVITRPEFMLQCIFNEYNVHNDKLKILNEMYNQMDRDHNGNVTLQDLQRFFKKKDKMKLGRGNSLKKADSVTSPTSTAAGKKQPEHKREQNREPELKE